MRSPAGTAKEEATPRSAPQPWEWLPEKDGKRRALGGDRQAGGRLALAGTMPPFPAADRRAALLRIAPPVTLTAFGLVLLSAALHVAWNTLARAKRDEPLLSWLLATAGAVVLVPPFVLSWLQGAAPLAREVVGFAALSGAVETVAFLALTAGYRTSDLSLIYPLSRGLAPVLAAAAGAFVASERIDGGELLAVAVVLAGAAWLAFMSPSAPASSVASSGATSSGAPASARRWRGVGFAALCACGVAGYHLSDRAALHHASQPDTWCYFLVMQLFLVGFMSLWLLARRELTLVALRRAVPLVPRMLLGGALMQSGYWLVLLALKQGASSLVVATRNLGIPMSLAVGALLFHERVDARRWCAALLITAGVLLLAN